MKYRISKRAGRDLDSIWRYLAKNASIDTAERVEEEFRRAIKSLAEMPGMGHERAELRGKPYRFWAVYSYLIVYRVEGGTLIVVRVIHGARDLDRLFNRN